MQAEVHSRDSLDDLERALAAFSSKATDAMAAMSSEFLRRQADLDGREDNAQSEVNYWTEALELAEAEDERESAPTRCPRHGNGWGRIRDWQARVQEEFSVFLTQTARFKRLLDQTVPKGQGFLRTRTEELRAYAAVQPQAGGAGNVNVSRPISPPAGGVASTGPMRLTEHRLPNGFVWVPLAEISAARVG